MNLSNQQFKILKAFATYRFLTASQLVLLELGHPGSIRRSLRSLAQHPQKAPLVKTKRFSVARFGRREYVHRLTPAGIQVLEEHRFYPTLRAPTSMYEADYVHRTTMITFRILLDQALGQGKTEWCTDEFLSYFEKTGANHRKSKGERMKSTTKVMFADGSHFIPDGLFRLRHSAGTQIGFAFELLCGRDRKRALSQIYRNLNAICEHAVAAKLGLPAHQGSAALFVFLNRGHMERILFELSNDADFALYRPYILLAAVDDLERDILRYWRRVGDSTHLYHLLDGETSNTLPTTDTEG